MRTWTLFVSICAHALAIGVMVVIPLFAMGTLPDPRHALTFETIIPIEIPRIPEPVRAQPEAQPTADASRISIIEPHDLPDDVPRDSHQPAIADTPDAGKGNSFSGIGVVSGADLTPPPEPTRVPPVRVGGTIHPPTRVSYIAPVYPPLAIAIRKEGTVILEAVLDETGAVINVKVMRSIPFLDDAAVQAVSRWRFTPTRLNGVAVPVVMTVTVTFTLNM